MSLVRRETTSQFDVVSAPRARRLSLKDSTAPSAGVDRLFGALQLVPVLLSVPRQRRARPVIAAPRAGGHAHCPAGELHPRERWQSFLVTPQTVLDWHRQMVRRRWTYRHRRPRRPRYLEGLRGSLLFLRPAAGSNT
jgi:hypothetical protein